MSLSFKLVHFIELMQKSNGISAEDAVVTGVFSHRPATAEEVAEKWMSRYDVDHDGRISRDEFLDMADHIDFSPVMSFYESKQEKKTGD